MVNATALNKVRSRHYTTSRSVLRGVCWEEEMNPQKTRVHCHGSQNSRLCLKSSPFVSKLCFRVLLV